MNHRFVRYGAPIALIAASVLVAAADTGSLGNDVQLAGTAAGLIWLMVVLGRDLGMGVTTGRRAHVPDPPSSAHQAAGGPDDRHPPASPS